MESQVRLCQQNNYTVKLLVRVVRDEVPVQNWKAQALAAFRLCR